MRRNLRGLVLVYLMSLSAYGEEIKLSMGTTPMSNIFSKIGEPFEKETGIKLIYVQKDKAGHGSDLVFKDVDEGVAEAGAGGTSWDNWQDLLKQKNYTPKNPSEIKSRVIGRDRIQVVTYKGGPKNLTEQQIKDIFTGKIKNFKEVGGEDQSIEIVLLPNQSATKSFFEKYIGGKIDGIIKNLEAKATLADMMTYTGSTKGAIAIGPLNGVTSDVNVPTHEAIGRPITFIFRSSGQPPEKIEKLLNFIKTKSRQYGVAE